MKDTTLKLKDQEISMRPGENGFFTTIKSGEKEYEFFVPSTIMLYFYETLFGINKSFGVKSKDGNYILVVKHKNVDGKESEPPEGKEPVDVDEIVIFLVYDAKEKKEKAIVSISLVLRALRRIRDIFKETISKLDRFTYRFTNFLLIKTKDVFTFVHDNKQYVVDYSNRDEFKDRLIEMVLSGKEKDTIKSIKFNKDEAVKILLLLTH